jgi:hypothetical protein
VRVCLDLPYAIQILGGWLFNWQTLISGILALVAAGLAGRLLNKQILKTEALANEQLQRQHNAARVALSLTLAQVLQSCQNTGSTIAYNIEKIDKHADLTGAIPTRLILDIDRRMKVPDDAINFFFTFLGTLTDEKEVKHVGELVSRIQIFQSKLSAFDTKNIIISDGLYNLLIDCAVIKFLTESIFNYVRFVDHESFATVGVISDAVAWNSILVSADGLYFTRHKVDNFHTKVSAKIAEYKKKEISPWLEKFE